jgi:putative ribosome biogenesis GTPase RsgA
MTDIDAAIKASMKAYDAVKVKHLNLSDAMDELSTLECPSFKNRVVLLVGPTGVGKSALVESLSRQFSPATIRKCWRIRHSSPSSS